MTSTLRVSLAGAVCIAGASCTSFATVRSAAVADGPSAVAQGSLASPPGDAAGWFWSDDCAENCNYPVGGVDVAFAHGRTSGGTPFTLGGGVNGLYPYVEGYMQLSRSARVPAGVGARVGIPLRSWNEHQVYGRIDVPVARDVVLLWNPGVVYHTGTAPNGDHPGTFLGLVQAVGLQTSSRGPVRVVPSAGLVWGRAERRGSAQAIGPEYRLFGFGALALQFARR